MKILSLQKAKKTKDAASGWPSDEQLAKDVDAIVEDMIKEGDGTIGVKAVFEAVGKPWPKVLHVHTNMLMLILCPWLSDKPGVLYRSGHMLSLGDHLNITLKNFS